METMDYLWCVLLPSNFPMTQKPGSGTQAALPSTTKGLGHHFASPHKKRNPQKTQTFVSFPGQVNKCQCLLNRLDNLFNHKTACESPGCEAGLDAAPENFTLEMEVIENMVQEADDHEPTDCPPLLQQACLDHLFSHWKSVISTIFCPYLEYLGEMLGRLLTWHPSSLSACLQDCNKWSTNITCLYFDFKSLLCLVSASTVLNIL